MELTITNPTVWINDAEKIDLKNCEFSIYTSHTDGRIGNKITLELRSKNTNTEESDYMIAFEINKNQALYVKKFIDAFIKEKEIDPNAED